MSISSTVGLNKLSFTLGSPGGFLCGFLKHVDYFGSPDGFLCVEAVLIPDVPDLDLNRH